MLRLLLLSLYCLLHFVCVFGGNCDFTNFFIKFLFHQKNPIHLHSRKWKREQRKSEIMRSFPPSYISNAPGHPNPHLAATYMANLNKAAAYAAAAAASRHSVMTATANAGTNYGPPQTAAGPNYGPPQNPMATSVTSQEVNF